MKKLFVVLLVLVCSTNVFAQDGSLHFDMLTSPIKFSLDGEKSVFKAPFLFGVKIDLNLFGLEFSPGLYSAFEVDTSEDGDFKLSSAAHVGLYKIIGFGFYYDFWQSGDGNGVTGPKKVNTGFLITIDFSFQ